MLLTPDPYISFLIRREFPYAQIVEATVPGRMPVGEPPGYLAGRIDVAIIDLDGPQASEFLVRQPGIKVIGIAEGRRVAPQPDAAGVQGLILRPLIPSELYRAIRQTAGIADGGEEAAAVRPDRRAHWVLGGIRLALVSLAGLLEVTNRPLTPASTLILAAVAVYAGLCLTVRRRSTLGAFADLLVAAAAIALSGGMTSPYAPFGVLASVETGLVWGGRRGLLASLLPALCVAPLMIAASHGAVPTSPLLAWTALFPLASLVAAPLQRRQVSGGRHGTEQLAEANRVLSSLLRIARTMPDALDIASVSAASLEELRGTLHRPAGAVVLREAGLVSVVGAFGLAGWEDIDISEDAVPPVLFPDDPIVISAIELPPGLQTATRGYPSWAVAPLRRDGITFGVLLAACDNAPAASPILPAIQQLADETALAIENARLFAHVRDLSADDERRRLAHELHDGVAQSLMHVRLELELLAHHGSAAAEITDELSRLARVTGNALTDVRSTIDGLRARFAGGLAEALRSYVRDLQGLGGPTISFVVAGATPWPPDVEGDVFRVAQEAVSNAARHARASQITVCLEATETLLRLVVEDDGVGFPSAPGNGQGLGLETMRERSLRLGGRLVLSPGRTAGSRVELLIGSRHGAEVGPTAEVRAIRADDDLSAMEALSA